MGARSVPERPRVGISRCLLGDEVRYDGGHKRDRVLTDVLGRVVEWVQVCPEVEVGMGVPREPIHLVASADGEPAAGARARLIGVTSGADWTGPMVRFGRNRVRALRAGGLSGFVLKKDSPSCGLAGVPVHAAIVRPEGAAGRSTGTRRGRGLFAEAIVRGMPGMPVEEEARLQDPDVRAHFIEQVFAYSRLRAHFAGRWTLGSLVRFHAAHKLQLLAHARGGYTRLGRLVAGAKGASRRELAAAYQREFMNTLVHPTSPGRHVDVLLHAAGHLKRLLTPRERDQLIAGIAAYRRGAAPLRVCTALLRDHARAHRIEYLCEQTYFTAEGHLTSGLD